jgi:exodeoxyribonuclease V alpha subunit
VGADVDPETLVLALEAGGWPREIPVAERRAFALLVLASCEARREGSTRLGLEDGLPDRLSAFCAGAGDRAAAVSLAAARLAHPALAGLVGGPGDRRPFIVDGPYLYHARDLRLEQRVAEALAARLAPNPSEPRPVNLPPAAAGRTWTPGQAAAIAAAVEGRLTVVTGGPGSGKTAVIGGIVRAWRAAGLPAAAIAVAAPTGKAANRAAEALAAENTDVAPPSTLHRLLGYAPRRGLGGADVRHHPNNPLPHLAVVVDEASMVDLALLDQLLRALRPEARLVLVGDAGQLPAIAAGSVFRDLAASSDPWQAGFTVRLTESHRMSPADASGAEILAVARGIAAGQPPVSPAVSDPSALRFVGFEHLDPGEAGAARRALSAFVDRWYAAQVRMPPELDPRLPLQARAGVLEAASAARAGALLDRHRRARLLTVTRVGRAGADRINDELARRAAADLDQTPLGKAALRQHGAGPLSTDLLPAGTPVIVVENDYDRGLMNGDQGLVLPVAADDQSAVLTALFPRAGSFALFPVATLRGLVQTAYAITVHKAQGSEVDRAALLLPDTDMPLLSRELIYTAATRARASMVVVGRTALLAQSIARPLGRTSGLAERLIAACARRPGR